MNTALMKRQRLLLGLSQREVAEAVGRTRATVASWETNRKTPEAKVLPELARMLQVSIEDLLADTTGLCKCGAPATGFIRTTDGIEEFCSAHAGAPLPTTKEAS